MSKRIMSVVMAMLLIVALAVNAFAASGSGQHSASEESSSSGSSSGSSWTPAPQAETTPTGQPITDAYVAALASTMTDGNGGAVAPISKQTVIAFSKYFKLLLGGKWAIIGAASDNGKGGKRTLKGHNYVAGLTYTVFAQVAANGAVSGVAVQAPVGNDGVCRFTLPAGTITYCVATHAVV